MLRDMLHVVHVKKHARCPVHFVFFKEGLFLVSCVKVIILTLYLTSRGQSVYQLQQRFVVQQISS